LSLRIAASLLDPWKILETRAVKDFEFHTTTRTQSLSTDISY
jgi:hypothetical protein